MRIIAEDENGDKINVVISRTSEARIIDEKLELYSTNNIPWATFAENGKNIKKGAMICDWDPYNAVIISEIDGKIGYTDITEELHTVSNQMNKQDSKKK